MNHHIFNNLFILLILFFSSTSLFSKTTINVFHTYKESGLHIQELKNSIVLNYNSKGLLIDSTIYSHTTPLNKKYVYVTGKEERLKLERTFKKEVILSYLFEYNKAGKKMSITLYGNDDNILWKEFLKYDSNQNLIKKLKPVTFKWKKDIFNKNMRNKKDVGFIAQELEEILPLCVKNVNIDNDSYKYLKHERIIPYLVNTIQELIERVEYLEKKI